MFLSPALARGDKFLISSPVATTNVQYGADPSHLGLRLGGDPANSKKNPFSVDPGLPGRNRAAWNRRWLSTLILESSRRARCPSVVLTWASWVLAGGIVGADGAESCFFQG